MAKRRKAICVRCQRTAREVGLISKRGLCADCSTAAQLSNAHQMVARQGPYYDAWRAGIVAHALQIEGADADTG